MVAILRARSARRVQASAPTWAAQTWAAQIRAASLMLFEAGIGNHLLKHEDRIPAKSIDFNT